MMKRTPQVLLLCLLLLGLKPAFAQLEITITQGSASALPIAVVPFLWEGSGLPPDTDIAQVIVANLHRSGQFKPLPEQDLVDRPNRVAQVNFATWRLLRQDYLVFGRVAEAPEGRFRVEFELYDINTQARRLGLAISGRASEMRSVAHQISDLIYEEILKVRGAFWTRIAYVTSTRTAEGLRYALMVADADGHAPQTVVRSSEPLMSPAWSPDGQQLAYVSFERGNSAIYMQDLATGSRRQVSSQPGINGAPSFSPDGRQLSLTLSRTGNPEIHLLDLASSNTTQLTRHWAIDTESVWLADGRSLLFTSDRGGKPQIYRLVLGAEAAERITPRGDYNARASVSFDGRKVAMVRGEGNVYRIAVLDLELGDAGYVSNGPMDESPSFAPNGSMILYASREEGGRGVLNAVSADGQVRQRLVLGDGDVREPAWSPFRQR